MQSNYRHHHYLLSTTNPATQNAAPVSQSSQSQSSTSSSAGTSLSLSSSSSSPLTQTPSSSPNKLRQQYHQQRQQVHLVSSPASYMNGLPITPTQNTTNLCKSKASSSNRQQQQQQQISSSCSSNCDSRLTSTQDHKLDQLAGSPRHSNGNGRYFLDIQQHQMFQHSPLINNHNHQRQQQQQQQLQPRSTSREYFNEGMPLDIPASQRAKQQQFTTNSTNINNNNNNDTQATISNKQQREYLHQQQLQNRRFKGEFSRHEDQDFDGEDELDKRSDVDNGFKSFNQHKYSPQQDNYTSQIRNSQLQQRFQQQSKIVQSGPNSTASMSQQQQQQQQQVSYRNLAGTSSSGGNPSGNKLRPQSPTSSSSASPQSPSSSFALPTANHQQQACKKSSAPLHVNFNRSNQVSGGDDDEGDSRKKKYLTAKYGQQQMNLIKKRLKIEMWLYEQLQDLAKGSKSEAELDDIDIDLDQLLDMDDDDTRRRWLKKTLEPFEDVPREKIDRFIGEVLEQSKLL